MNIWKRNSFAIAAMVLMIAVGTLAGSHNTLMGMRNKASTIFIAGVRGDGIGIQGDLREREGKAYDMVMIARKYLPEDNALIQNVLKARDALNAASTVKGKAAANRALETAVKDLFDVLSGMTLSESDARYPQSLYTNFRSRGDTIGHDPYNAAAAGFNDVLAGFPAGVLGGISGVQPLELFE